MAAKTQTPTEMTMRPVSRTLREDFIVSPFQKVITWQKSPGYDFLFCVNNARIHAENQGFQRLYFDKKFDGDIGRNRDLKPD